MNNYVTGSVIRTLREQKKMTQLQLAEVLAVSDKTISKWETGKGFPDISLLEPLAKALGVSVPELLSGEQIINKNRASNMVRSRLYVCPLCGNVLFGSGEAMISCCGIALPPAEAEEADAEHSLVAEQVEDDWFVSVVHPMEKGHYISFMAYVNEDRLQLVKLYPEGNAEARFPKRGRGWLYWYCNHHGLYRKRL